MRPDFATPQSAAIDHVISLDFTLIGNHPGNAAIGLADAGDAHALETERATATGPLDEGLGDIDRTRGTILRNPTRAEQITGFEVRDKSTSLLRR